MVITLKLSVQPYCFPLIVNWSVFFLEHGSLVKVEVFRKNGQWCVLSCIHKKGFQFLL